MSSRKLDEPLESAYAFGNVADVKQLLHDYEDLSVFSWKLEEPLESACASDMVADVKQLLNGYEDQTHMMIKLFYRAVANNSVGVLEFLFSLEYDFSSQDVSYYFARGRVLPETSALFRSHGWDVDAMAAANPMKWEHMANRVIRACESDDLGYFCEILAYEDSMSDSSQGQDHEKSALAKAMEFAVDQAIPAHACSILQHALSRGANANPRRFIMGPKEDVSLEILQILIDHGFDINSYDMLFKVAMDADKVRWCLAHGANPAAASGPTLGLAASTGDMDLWKSLRSQGAPLQRDLLHLAARSACEEDTQVMRENYFQLVRHLVEREHMDPNMLDRPSLEGLTTIRQWRAVVGTPLHYCVEAEGPGLGVVQYLLEAGADPNAPDLSGVSALERARERSCSQFINAVQRHMMVQHIQSISIGEQ